MPNEADDRLHHLREKVALLNIIIREGELYQEFKESSFYEVFSNIFTGLKETYLKDAYKASRDSRAEISSFLGRMEQIDDMFDILGQFPIKAGQAKLERTSLEEEIDEINDQMNEPGYVSQDVGGVMG